MYHTNNGGGVEEKERERLRERERERESKREDKIILLSNLQPITTAVNIQAI